MKDFFPIFRLIRRVSMVTHDSTTLDHKRMLRSISVNPHRTQKRARERRKAEIWFLMRLTDGAWALYYSFLMEH